MRHRKPFLIGVAATASSCVANLAYLVALILWQSGRDVDPDTGFWFAFLATGVGGLALSLSSRLRPVGLGIILGSGLAFAAYIAFAWVWVLPQVG